MQKHKRTGRCRECRKTKLLSNRGLCRPCGRRLSLEARRQLQAKKGPVYERYLKAWNRAMERIAP